MPPAPWRIATPEDVWWPAAGAAAASIAVTRWSTGGSMADNRSSTRVRPERPERKKRVRPERPKR
ncbi:MAG: hypothetical protein ACREK5_03190, partial [Gemmatimonadota bacterium]